MTQIPSGSKLHKQLTAWFLVLIMSLAAGLTTASAMSEEKEIELGKQLNTKIIASFGVYPDPALQAYVNEVGQKLAAISDRSHLEFHFTILNDDLVNAMALPGGYIYITRGLLAHLRSEAELASVLGHEIGHVTAFHSIKRERGQKLTQLLSVATTIATKSTVGGEATGLLGGALVSGYGRNQELEADALGAKYLAKTGYPTEAVIRTVEVLKRTEQFEIERARIEDREPRSGHGLFATHPDNDKRLAEAVEAAKEFASDEQGYDDNVDAFLDRLNGLRWGSNRIPGVFRSNWFYNSKYGIKIKFPNDWRVGGKPGVIHAVSADNNAILQVLGVIPGRTMGPLEVAQRKLGIGQFREVNEVTVSGMKAILAVADRWNSPFGPRPVRVAVIMDNRKRQAFVFAGTSRHDLSKLSRDEEYIATIFSFDHMKRSELPLGQPPTIKVVRAEEGTTYADLAKVSSVPAFAEQELRLINGQYPRGEPEPGQLIKVID